MFLFPAVSDDVKSYPLKPVTSAGGKEFDPLSRQRHPDNTQSKVMSSFGLSNDGGCYYYIISHCSNGYRSCLLTAGLLLHGSCTCYCHTVVPAMAGHSWFRGKVALRGRWPLVTGNGHMRHYVKSNTHIRQHIFHSKCTTLYITAVNYNTVYSER